MLLAAVTLISTQEKKIENKLEDKLVLEVDLENDALSLSHNIDDFFFTPTANYESGSKKNINNIKYAPLKDHLVATALVRMNGEVVGIATETEIVYLDDPKNLRAHSMWSIKLNAPGLNGFISVEQMEDTSKGAALMGEVFQNPNKKWKDEWHMLPRSVKGTKVQHASGDLAEYNGGKFQEFNGTNQADLKKYGKFRGKISIEVYKNNAVSQEKGQSTNIIEKSDFKNVKVSQHDNVIVLEINTPPVNEVSIRTLEELNSAFSFR